MLNLLGDAALDALLTGESRFDALPETMSALARSAGDTLCHVAEVRAIIAEGPQTIS